LFEAPCHAVASDPFLSRALHTASGLGAKQGLLAADPTNAKLLKPRAHIAAQLGKNTSC
jgi:hypothetical protein